MRTLGRLIPQATTLANVDRLATLFASPFCCLATATTEN